LNKQKNYTPHARVYVYNKDSCTSNNKCYILALNFTDSGKLLSTHEFQCLNQIILVLWLQFTKCQQLIQSATLSKGFFIYETKLKKRNAHGDK